MRFFQSSSTILLLFCLFSPAALVSADFSFVRNTGAAPGPTLLITAGIDGDEPGGIHAAATLITRYQIKTGQLWVAPDLNTEAILLRKRGEMNLKFAAIEREDPMIDTVERLKAIVRNQQVDLLVNLHDGSGFYHPTRLSSERNPYRWGQSIVIDQQTLPEVRFGELHHLAATIIAQAATRILADTEHFHIKNMHTASLNSDALTRKSLSWFALRHAKPAMSIEASKTHPVHIRTYYHLITLEALMDTIGIKFTRDFELTPQAVAQVIREDAQITLAQGRILLDLNKINRHLYNFPLPDNPQAGISVVNPLISLQPEGNGYRVHYGNNRLALLHPQQVTIDPAPEPVTLIIDGQRHEALPGSQVMVNTEVTVRVPADSHIRVVGLNNTRQEQQTLHFTRNELHPQAAIDQAGTRFRLEVYRGGFFSGMIVLNYRQGKKHKI